MKRKGFKYVISAGSAMVLVLAFGYLTTPDNGGFKFLQTSMLSILQQIAAENRPLDPDLTIETVTLKKLSDPSADFNYYRYAANVVIKNLGGKIKNSKVVLGSSDDQGYIFVKNSEEGLTLEKNQSVIVEDYDVILAGDYNGGEIELDVAIKDRPDGNEKNNKKAVKIFEGPAKIEAIGIEEILEDGTIVLEFDIPKMTAGERLEILVSETLPEAEKKYAETHVGGKIYGFHRIKNGLEAIENGKWQINRTNKLEARFLKLDTDPFKDEQTRYVFVRAVNPETGSYLASNILGLGPQEEINRAEFAKLMVDYAEMEIFDKGVSIYEDVSLDSWYGSYVQTLYNLGLIKTGGYKYMPDKAMGRGEALRVVLDYFDVDLATGGEGGHFKDVAESDKLYPYAEALYESGRGGIFGDNFSPELPATKDFLKHLVYAYSQNS